MAFTARMCRKGGLLREKSTKREARIIAVAQEEGVVRILCKHARVGNYQGTVGLEAIEERYELIQQAP